MAQLKSKHTTAGGRDPTQLTQEHLREINVPIRAAGGKSAKAKRVRRERAREVVRLRRLWLLAGREGFTTWSNYKLSKFTRVEGGVNRDEYKARRDCLKVASVDAGDVSGISDDSFDVSTAYRKSISTKLWGCSSLSEPLRCDVPKHILEKELDGMHLGATLGMTERLESLRTSLCLRDCYVAE